MKIVFYVVFCGPMLIFFSFWSLHCLSSDLELLLPPLVSFFLLVITLSASTLVHHGFMMGSVLFFVCFCLVLFFVHNVACVSEESILE
jgi:hypothetical protein